MRARTPGDLIPGFYGTVIAQIQPPISAINPPDRAPINLGLWLATEGPTQIVESGPIGPFNASVTARLAETTFDMADGTVVRCQGGGVAIADLDTIEEGPCGHNFTADLDDGAHIAMQGRWEVSYVTSIGSGRCRTSTPTPPYRTRRMRSIPSAARATDVRRLSADGE